MSDERRAAERSLETESSSDVARASELESSADVAKAFDEAGIRPEHVRALRLGHGANCSSVGSVIDTLFVGAAVGGAIFAAICAAMRDEPVRVVGTPSRDPETAREDEGARAERAT